MLAARRPGAGPRAESDGKFPHRDYRHPAAGRGDRKRRARAWGTPLATAIADCRLLGRLSLPPALAGANCSCTSRRDRRDVAGA